MMKRMQNKVWMQIVPLKELVRKMVFMMLWVFILPVASISQQIGSDTDYPLPMELNSFSADEYDSQKHLKVSGISMGKSTDVFLNELAKRFNTKVEHVSEDGKGGTVFGMYKGKQIKFHVYGTPKTNRTFLVMATVFQSSDWNSLVEEYHNQLPTYLKAYGTSSETLEGLFPNAEGIRWQGNELWCLDHKKGDWYTCWKLPEGEIWLEIKPFVKS